MRALPPGSVRTSGIPVPVRRRRCAGDRGAGMATALVLLFAMTAGGVVWLAGDVDRAISNRSAAHSIAFQAARSGAQLVDLTHLRTWDEVIVDDTAARIESAVVAARLLDAYELTGDVTSVDVDRDRVTVIVTVTDGGRTVTGIGSARAVDGRTAP